MGRKKIVKPDENVHYWLERGIDIKARRIMIDKDVDSETIGLAIRSVIKMVEIDTKHSIDVFINSYGGDAYDCFALYDILESSPCQIRTFALGKIMSAGLILFLVGHERRAFDRASFMAHSISSGVRGNLSEIQTEYEETKRLQHEMLDILTKKTKKSLKWWEKEIQHSDRYYNIKKAFDLGIITHDEKLENRK